MITKEQARARYFAAHWGGTGTYKNQYGKFRFEIGKHFFHGQFEDNNTFKLHLRPLSAITDEHWQLLLMEFEQEGCKDYEYCDGVFSFYWSITADTSYIPLPYIPSNVADTLRLLGYHTGNFLGFDPIAEGWCVVE